MAAPACRRRSAPPQAGEVQAIAGGTALLRQQLAAVSGQLAALRGDKTIDQAKNDIEAFEAQTRRLKVVADARHQQALAGSGSTGGPAMSYSGDAAMPGLLNEVPMPTLDGYDSQTSPSDPSVIRLAGRICSDGRGAIRGR